MTTEKLPSFSQRIFNLVRDIPNLTEENIHEFMCKDLKYKTSSGKALIYRLICAKYIRKDKNGIFHAHIDEYKPLPPFKARRKKKVVKPASVKVKAAPKPQPLPTWATIVEEREKEPAPKPAKRDFLVELGRRIGSYFRA